MWYGDKKIAKEMSKDQLENKLYFGLEYLNVGNSYFNGSNFKYKDTIKKKEPQWPQLMEIFTQKSLKNLLFQCCNFTKADMELLSYSLH